jgi:hypothetical protein
MVNDILEIPKNPNTLAPIYTILFIHLKEKARELGYALTLHGSMTRDGDMVAIPWTKDAVSAEELVSSLHSYLGAHCLPQDYVAYKPHGRRAWSLHLSADFGCDMYVDLSVMPRLDEDEHAIQPSPEDERKAYLQLIPEGLRPID